MATATSFMSGDVIKNESVTPSGMPPFTKPIKSGIDEQEQNGVMAPNNEAKKYCRPNSFFEVKKLRKRSIGI